MRAVISHVVAFSLVDGPGSRTAIFFQGCNLSCRYCHNPETQQLCNHCGDCVQACQSGAVTLQEGVVRYEPSRCARCDRCIAKCPSNSSPRAQEMSVEELVADIVRDSAFLDGITVSGGECTLRHGFVHDLFSRVRDTTSLTTFVDTNALVTTEVLERLCEVTDGFMVDLKAIDAERHRALTGGDNKSVLRNIQLLCERGLLYEVRVVLVPGYTDRDDEIRAIAEFLHGLASGARLRLIPFRPEGVLLPLGQQPPLSRARLDELATVAREILGERVVCQSTLSRR